MSNFPTALSVGQSGNIQKMDPAEWDNDPRGILWMWKPPMKHRKYILGGDPSTGRTGWTRYIRSREDSKTDNGALEVVMLGRRNQGLNEPDEQVAEYAAPVDAFELGFIANIIGRIYAGVDEDQCGAILEIHPGPGTMTYRQMCELGYTNHFHWEKYANTQVTPTKQMGWVATPTTNRDLWSKSSRHINLRNAIIRSPWLAEEFADCRYDPDKQSASNPGGHDDRVRAFNLALWMANGWSLSLERTEEEVKEITNEPPSLQASDCTIEEMEESWERTMDRISGGGW
jgi:hypothetical protein